MSWRRTALIDTSILAALFALAGEMSPATPEAHDRSGARPLRSAPRTLRLNPGESAVLTVRGTSALELQTFTLDETSGSEVVIRLTAIGEEGELLGSGRLVTMDAMERREVALGDVPELPRATGVRIESLQGEGAARVTVSFDAEIARPDAGSSSRLHAVRTATTAQLIDAAEAARTIDSETALVYRVFALFGDARLPPQFQGASDRSEDSLYLAEVHDRFATLSPATQAIVQPFLTPPAYADSWINAARRARASDSPPPCAIFSDRWTGVDTTNGMVRVWYRVGSDDALRANGLAAEIDAKIWPALAGMMPTHLPLSDLGESCNGGNGRLDIYLVEATKSLTTPYRGCATAPVFILLKRDTPFALAAHEIFHAFEFSFPLGGCIFDRTKYRWWAEASAEWAQDFVYPADQTEQGKAPAFLGFPEKPLDDADDQHAYGAYLFPFFIKNKGGGTSVIRQAWENCAGQPALEAVDKALPGGFAGVWPQFVVSNWNRDPITDYKSWDALGEGAEIAGGSSSDVSLGGSMDASESLDVDLPRLSATYRHYVFKDDAVRTVAFWNGVTSNLTLQDDYQTAAAPQDRKKGAKVQALVKIRNQNWKLEDWTDRQFVTYCRDTINERIEELVIIISNSEFSDRNRKLRPTGLAPVLWVSNMGCWKWKGTASLVASDGTSTITVQTDVTWTPQGAAAPPFIGYTAQGTENWSVSGPCTGHGSFPLNASLDSLRTFNFTPPSGHHHRVYQAAGLDTQQVTVTCPDSNSATFTLVPWLIVPAENFPDGSQPLQVEPSGKQIFYVSPSTEVLWQWQFNTQRE